MLSIHEVECKVTFISESNLSSFQIICLENLSIVCDHHDLLSTQGHYQPVLSWVIHKLSDLVEKVRLSPDLCPRLVIFPDKSLVAGQKASDVDACKQRSQLSLRVTQDVFKQLYHLHSQL